MKVTSDLSGSSGLSGSRETPDPSKPGQKRELLTLGVQMIVGLRTDDLILARALRQRRFGALHAAALVAHTTVLPALASTDPALFRTLRDGITLFFLKGYGMLSLERLERLAARERSLQESSSN